MLALVFYDVLSQAFGASIASDYTSCSSSFCTFSLSTRHCSRWISCICQHLKIVWESSKSDPFSLGKIIRHTFALHAARKMKKCDHFGGSSTPFPPRINVGSCDYDRIYASVSTSCFNIDSGGWGVVTNSSPSCEMKIQ